jgi:hypothetical protein
MKRAVILIMITVIFVCLNAFQEGTINVEGTASLSVTKLNEGASSIRTGLVSTEEMLREITNEGATPEDRIAVFLLIIIP